MAFVIYLPSFVIFYFHFLNIVLHMKEILQLNGTNNKISGNKINTIPRS